MARKPKEPYTVLDLTAMADELGVTAHEVRVLMSLYRPTRRRESETIVRAFRRETDPTKRLMLLLELGANHIRRFNL